MLEKQSRQFGFSLIELSVILLIVGVIGSGSVLLFSEQKTHASWQESDAKLKVVKSALLSFVYEHKYMPCPDTLESGSESRSVVRVDLPAVVAVSATLVEEETDESPAIPGVEGRTAVDAISGVSVSVCDNHRGTVPYEAIGLSRAQVSDKWGNLFIYAVDQGVTQGAKMLDCPKETACFFNQDALSTAVSTDAEKENLQARKLPFLPAFNLKTEPVMGLLGASNLTLCANASCASIVADGQVAVLVSLNDDSQLASGLGEAENKDSDTLFVKGGYTQSPFYDDLVLGISANEIKTRDETAVIEIVVAPPVAPPTSFLGNDLQGMGDNSVGTIGTNIGTDDAIEDRVTQTFDFGADAANKEIVLTLETHARGGWNQPANRRSSTWSDRASITSNEEVLRDFRYDRLDDNWLVSEMEQVTFISAIDGWYSDFYNEDGTWDDRYFEIGEEYTSWAPTWDETHEYVVLADENGQVSVDFAVQTTATVETIDFTNIELLFYNTPPPIPTMPSVKPIDDIIETEGLL
ncbi:MAG: hypothetical protein GXO35_01260 [Gammaproteobacteria bacterium]|nr:hypothetical protein [Gammaproteobacteria bacterium]